MNAGQIWIAFQQAAVAWKKRRDPDLNEGMRLVLDAAADLHGLLMLGDVAALRTLAKKSRTALEAAQRRARRAPKGDEGAKLVAVVRGALERGESDGAIAELVHVHANGPTLGAWAADDGSGQRHGLWPTEGQLRAASKAIGKHRRDDLHTGASKDRRARFVLQHALEAFGLTADDAKTYAGVKRKK